MNYWSITMPMGIIDRAPIQKINRSGIALDAI